MKLLHRFNRQSRRLVPFYDGLLMAENGVVDIPNDQVSWVKRAWRALGYENSPDGRKLHDWGDVQAEMQRQENATDVPAKVTTQ